MYNWTSSRADQPLRCTLCALQPLHHPFNETGVQVNDEHSQEGHLLAGVLEDDPWVVGLASEAVGSHHHGQVVHIHLGNCDIGWLSKYLEIKVKEGEEKQSGGV